METLLHSFGNLSEPEVYRHSARMIHCTRQQVTKGFAGEKLSPGPETLWQAEKTRFSTLDLREEKDFSQALEGRRQDQEKRTGNDASGSSASSGLGGENPVSLHLDFYLWCHLLNDKEK